MSAGPDDAQLATNVNEYHCRVVCELLLSDIDDRKLPKDRSSEVMVALHTSELKSTMKISDKLASPALCKTLMGKLIRTHVCQCVEEPSAFCCAHRGFMSNKPWLFDFLRCPDEIVERVDEVCRINMC